MNRVVLVLFTTMLISASYGYGQENVDIIIINGKVTTMDVGKTEVEAIAISNNMVLLAGTNKEVLRLQTEQTTVINARGRRVLPGLFDSHLHFIRAGRYYNTELRWDGVKTLKRALEMLREQAKRTPEGQWVRVVGGWNEYQFEEKRLPTIDEINAASGNVPVFILYLYGKAWLNREGLRKLNINSETPNPPGGLIEKDILGNPTGLLVAEPNAYLLYSTLAKLPELTLPEKINSTLQYMTELNRLGVTAVMDAGGGFQSYPEDYVVIDSLYKSGNLTVRLPHFLFAQKKGSELADYTKWTSVVEIDIPSGDAIHEVEYHISGGGENLVAEAADFENFLQPRPELPPSMEANLKPVIQLLVKKRWPFRLHATYDETIARCLAVISEVNRETPLKGLSWFIDHAETISEHNMQRIKSLGGGISVQHRMAYQGESFIQRYGKKAALRAPPVRRMIEIGLPIALGTDGTRVASYNPWIALFWIVSGKTIGGTQVMSPDNVIDRFSALKLFTAGGYQLLKDDTVKGKISKGYFADIIILNKDYFDVPIDEIQTINSILTIVNGKVVYGGGEYNRLAARKRTVIPTWSPVLYYGGYQGN